MSGWKRAAIERARVLRADQALRERGRRFEKEGRLRDLIRQWAGVTIDNAQILSSPEGIGVHLDGLWILYVPRNPASDEGLLIGRRGGDVADRQLATDADSFALAVDAVCRGSMEGAVS